MKDKNLKNKKNYNPCLLSIDFDTSEALCSDDLHIDKYVANGIYNKTNVRIWYCIDQNSAYKNANVTYVAKR